MFCRLLIQAVSYWNNILCAFVSVHRKQHKLHCTYIKTVWQCFLKKLPQVTEIIVPRKYNQFNAAYLITFERVVKSLGLDLKNNTLWQKMCVICVYIRERLRYPYVSFFIQIMLNDIIMKPCGVLKVNYCCNGNTIRLSMLCWVTSQSTIQYYLVLHNSVFIYNPYLRQQ